MSWLLLTFLSKKMVVGNFLIALTCIVFWKKLLFITDASQRDEWVMEQVSDGHARGYMFDTLAKKLGILIRPSLLSVGDFLLKMY